MNFRSSAIFYAVLLSCVGIFIPGAPLHSQINLVMNPSFEDTIACPTGFSQLANANFWSSPSQGTPDLFHECSCPAISCVPVNPCGSQTARTGKAYAGIMTYAQTGFWREYIQVRLSDTLDAGAVYLLTYYVSLADEMWYATRKIGAYFSPVPLNAPTSSALPVTPHIENSTVILTSKTSWIALTDTFISTGGEEYLIIGNFNTDGNSDTLFVGGPNYNPGSYYFIDDVSLTLLSGSGFSDAPENSNSLFLIPNPTTGIFHFQSDIVVNEIEIYNYMGELVQFALSGSADPIIDLSAQPKGIYVVRAFTDEGPRIGRIIVE